MIVISFMGALPTIKKVYFEPESESASAWMISLLGNSLNLLAVENWIFAIAVYPLYNFAVCVVVNVLIHRSLFSSGIVKGK